MDRDVNCRCPGCGCSAVVDTARYAGHDLMSCSECSLLFEKHIPTDEDLVAHYATYSYSRLKKIPQSTFESYSQVLKLLTRGLESPALLDYGCGQGSFLLECKRCGLDAVGLEFSPAARLLCEQQGLMVAADTDICHKLYPEGFDIVSSFEVIEHLPRPRQMLVECYDLLRPGGLLYLTTPNSSAISLLIMGGESRVLGYPEHLCLFNARSISVLAKSEGFSVLKVWSSGVSVSAIKAKVIASATGRPRNCQDFSNAHTADQQINEKISQNASGRLAKTLLNGFVSRFGIGDTLKVLLQKS